MVRAFRDLARSADPAGRRLLLDGAHLVRTARALSLEFEAVVVAGDRLRGRSEEGALAEELSHAPVDVISASEAVFRAISPVATPSGITAIVRRAVSAPSAVYDRDDGADG